MGVGVALAGLALAGIGTAVQVKSAKDAAEEQEEIQDQQAALAAQKRIEERRVANRKKRIAQARIRQSAENTGTGGSSAESGALSSLSTQSAAERSGIFVREQGEQAISQAQQGLADANLQGQFGKAGTNLGLSLFKAGGGASIFSPAPTTPGVQAPVNPNS